MSDESEDVSSVETGDTSVSEESAPQAESGEAESHQAAPENKEEKQTPFHEHPRFKELIEQNRSFKEESAQRAQAFENMQRELQSLRQQAMPKKEAPVDPFLADLAKVNPEYAKSLQSVYDRANKADQIEQRLAQYEQQQFAEKAVSRFNNLMDTAKIADPQDKEIYQYAVEAEIYRREQKGQKLGLQDLDKIFNEFHGKYSKAMEERNRKLTASYVQSKKTDVTPKGSTGGTPSAPGFKKFKANDIAGQSKWLADQIRASKKI